MNTNYTGHQGVLRRATNELKRQFDAHHNILMALGENIFHCKSESSDLFYRDRIDFHLFMQDDLQHALHTIVNEPKMLFLPPTTLDMKTEEEYDSRQNLSEILDRVKILKRRLIMSISENRFDAKLVNIFRQHFLHLSILYTPESLLKLQG